MVSQDTLFKDMDAQEEEIQEEDDFAPPLHYSITSYGADYVVDSLVKRLESGSIYVPSFQRGYVWSPAAASRFIESLLLGLPVPGIFLSREENTQKLLVIDGQQRLLTIKYFYEGHFPNARPFALVSVQPRYEGRAYATLQEEDRRHLDDAIIHSTIIKQDEPEDDESSIYQVFERLNTGGTLLKPQEIRFALNTGEFTALLGELNLNPAWRSLFGAVSANMRDQELILRFFALYFEFGQYKKPMANFLNRFLRENRDLSVYPRMRLQALFEETVELIQRCLGRTVFKPRRALNAAIFDAVMVGVARNLDALRRAECELLATGYSALLANPEFIKATQTATTDEENIARRLDLATQAWAGVE